MRGLARDQDLLLLEVGGWGLVGLVKWGRFAMENLGDFWRHLREGWLGISRDESNHLECWRIV